MGRGQGEERKEPENLAELSDGRPKLSGLRVKVGRAACRKQRWAGAEELSFHISWTQGTSRPSHALLSSGEATPLMALVATALSSLGPNEVLSKW